MNASHSILNSNSGPENFKVGVWMRFIRGLGLLNMFRALPDSRQTSRTTYSLVTLVMWAFSLCSFRQPSKNAMQTVLNDLSPTKRTGTLQLLGSDQIPHSSTVDDALGRIDYENFNMILLQLFDRLNKRHFFYNHTELIPDNVFYIGADGFWTHTYTAPHAVDEKGCNCCPYCLPSVHHAGKPEEFTSWVHINVTFMLICEGITLPLYVYPLKAVQVNTDRTDADLKQECELLATRTVLPLLKKRHPHLQFTFLGDALYANKPFIQFLRSLDWGYIIVSKETTLKTLHGRCDELAKTEIYQKLYTRQELVSAGMNTFHRQAAWFNQADIGEGVYTNVLRFKEEVKKNDVIVDGYEGEWLCSMSLHKNNCWAHSTVKCDR